MKELKKINCIIDTDPGVDDSAAICLSFYDEYMDIRLITTVRGNCDIKIVTRNALHLLEKFNRQDIPVAVGAVKAMHRDSPDASWVHQNDGMGGYIPPKKVKLKPIEMDAVDAMYQTITKHAGNIVIIGLGPHTNIGTLIKKHPDVVNMVNHIYCEGCAPYGWRSEGRWKNYISFNASTDPEAMAIVLNSGIPITIIPSRMGRELANFNEKQIEYLSKINDTGRFLAEMYGGYWEHGYSDRRIATNDTCAVLAMRFPKLFKTKPVNFEVDVGEYPGKTIVTRKRGSKVELAYKVNRKKLHDYYFNAVKKLDNFRFYK